MKSGITNPRRRPAGLATRSGQALLLALGIVWGAGAQTVQPVLNHETARTIVTACEALAAEEGFRVAVAVYDQGAQLKYFSRMDGSFPLGVSSAQEKARSSALLPWSTGRIGEIAQQMPSLEHLDGITGLPGGMPIVTAAGVHLGGVGVSGGSGEQDEACAQAGLDAVSEVLSQH